MILAAPTSPASSLLSTSAIYSGRAPAGIRGTSALGGMRLSAPASSPFRSRSVSVLNGPEERRHDGLHLRTVARSGPECPGTRINSGPDRPSNDLGQLHAART